MVERLQILFKTCQQYGRAAELRAEESASWVSRIMQICHLPRLIARVEPYIVCFRVSDNGTSARSRICLRLPDAIYLYYQVVRALGSCNNIYLPRQLQVSRRSRLRASIATARRNRALKIAQLPAAGIADVDNRGDLAQ